jgi:hypothetical protein
MSARNASGSAEGSLFGDDQDVPAPIREAPSWFARMLAWRLNTWTFRSYEIEEDLRKSLLASDVSSVLLPPEGIEEDLRKTLLYWADFAGLDVPAEPSPALLSEFERVFTKHHRLEHKKITSAYDGYKVPNRAALAAVRELLG